MFYEKTWISRELLPFSHLLILFNLRKTEAKVGYALFLYYIYAWMEPASYNCFYEWVIYILTWKVQFYYTDRDLDF